ncbi:glycine zipper 2TM domain-containing protein [Novispirillum sp. DQ9]|uniref:glycine zipper 2TM domain-containing protein n=1 Tax=Novispirillum sp. DQ9 TaxID=3398612 RepID=UPI003C79DD63
MAPRRRFALSLVAAALLAACAPHSGDAYDRAEMGRPMTLDSGTVVSVREVRVKGTESQVGTGVGAVAGGIAGYQLGGESWINALGAVGGAVIGGLAGSAAERGLTADTAQEIIVQRSDGTSVAVVQKPGDYVLAPGQRVVIVRGDATRVVPADQYGAAIR